MNPPKEFSGENFEIFFVKHKAFMIMLDKDFALVYRSLEDLHAAPEPNTGTKSVIGKELLITGGDLTAERQSELRRVLYYHLIQQFQGEAFVELNSYQTEDGFECLRLLLLKYKPIKGIKNLATLQKILKMDLSEGKWNTNFPLFRENLKKYEQQTGSTLPEDIKISTFLGNTTGKFNEYLTLNVDI